MLLMLYKQGLGLDAEVLADKIAAEVGERCMAVTVTSDLPTPMCFIAVPERRRSGLLDEPALNQTMGSRRC